ncbi:MAG: tyrosine-type recombinase/integrase [bacterium]
MATFKYIIRKNKKSVNRDGTTIIFLRYTHRGTTAYFSSKKKIPIKYWNSNNQTVIRSYKGHSTLNMYLSKFRQKIEDLVNMCMYEGSEPFADVIRNRYDGEKNSTKGKQQKRRKQLNFEQFIKQFIEESKLTKQPSTIKSYNDFNHILNIYKKSRRIKNLTWESFTMYWYYDFMEFYVKERGTSNNTFGKMIKTLKTVLNAATDQGHNNNTEFRNKKFKVYQEEGDHIYLSVDEIAQLLSLDLIEDIKLERVRDIFVVGCYTGLRFSDFKQLSQQNIANDRLQIRTQKTGQLVVIPLHPIVKQILEKYDNNIPRTYCNSVTNRQLKRLGQLAGFNQTIVKTRTYGIQKEETVYQKWELLTTHCARRSFATNLFKQGFPSINIMKITGHKSEKSFMRYIRINEEEIASMLEKHWENDIKLAG